MSADSASRPVVEKGLKGVVISETTLSHIDGAAGTLIYRGYRIEDLADYASYEEVCHLLLEGHLPNRAELAEYTKSIAAENKLPDLVMQVIRAFPATATPIAVLRTAISALSETDPELNDDTEPANKRKAIRIIAKMPVILAAYLRLRKGLEPVEPRQDCDLSSNLLWCMNGTMPTEAMRRAVDLYLVLLAEHGMNASTFAAIVTASTRSDFYSSIVAAIGALKGPLHGGANEAAMNMLEKIRDPEHAREVVRGMLERKERVMGFGHRVYTTKDPRGTSLYKAAVKLLEESGNHNLLKICQTIEQEVFTAKGLNYNVDFYSAPVLNVLGFPTDTFVDLFAVSRSVGWSAHIIEFKRDPVLMRPRGLYVGPLDVKYVPLDERP